MQKFPLYFWTILLLHLVFLALRGPASEVANEESSTPLKVTVKTETESQQIVRSEESPEKKIRDEAFLSDKTRSFTQQRKARVVAPFKQKKEAINLGDLALDPGVKNPYQNIARETLNSRSSTNDHLPDIAPGDLTQLNTVEFKYYGFYHRIRQKLEQFWGRSLEEKAQLLARQGRSPGSAGEHLTHLVIVLNEKGQVLKVEMKSSSGIREFDEAALESINEAGPFPNPPRGMIENGRVTLEWGFIVKT